MFTGSVFNRKSQQGGQVHCLRCVDDGSAYVRKVDADCFDVRVAQVDAPQGGVRELRFHQLAVGELDGSELTIADIAVTQVAGGEAGLVDFAHREVQIPGIAVVQGQVVQGGFGQIGSYQFAGEELHAEEGTFRQRDIGQVATDEAYVREVAGFQFAVFPLHVGEGTVCDSLIGALDVFFRLLAEVQSPHGFFRVEPLFQRLGALGLLHRVGGGYAHRRHGERFVSFHGVCVYR